MVYIWKKMDMSVSKQLKGTVIKSKLTLPRGENLYILVAYILIGLPFILAVLDNIDFSGKNFVVLFCTIIVIYYLSSSSKITINPDNLIYKSNRVTERKLEIFWSRISKIVLNSDGFLVIYNNELDQDYLINLELFKNDDIQILLNLLNQKTQVEIETEIQKSEGFIINKGIPNTSVSSGRRRIVANSDNRNSVDKTNNNSSGRTRVMVNDAPDIKPANDSPKVGSGRRLEL